MFVKIRFLKTALGVYGGPQYLYRTALPLTAGTRVMAPTSGGERRALVTETGVSPDEIDPKWAHRIREITELDEAEEEKR